MPDDRLRSLEGRPEFGARQNAQILELALVEVNEWLKLVRPFKSKPQSKSCNAVKMQMLPQKRRAKSAR